MKPEQREQLIEGFLQKTLSQDEVILFKKTWDSDPSFVKEVRDYAELMITLKAADHYFQENGPIKKVGKPTNWLSKTMAIAASITILGLAVLSYLLLSGSDAHQLSHEFMIDHRLSSVRSGEQNNSPIDNALKAYGNGDIRNAISIMKSMAVDNNAQALFITGDLYLVIEQPDSALTYYSKGLNLIEEDPYTSWNIIMAWLQKGLTDKAREQLKQMVESGQPPYASKATHLLKEMDHPGFKIKNWSREL